jgi:TIR domain
MPKIAISYRRRDSAQIAGRIRERLAAHYGKESIFIDVYDVPLGSEFPRHVEKVWSEADVLLALIGLNWLKRDKHLWPAIAVPFLLLPAFLLLVAHYVIVNALDLHTIYLRLAVFLIPLPFGAALYWGTRTSPMAVFAAGALLGLIGVAGMTISTSLRYQQPIMPSGRLEWLENLEYVVLITLGFWLGNISARLPRISSLFPEREDWVRVEIETALQRNVPIIPVLLDGAPMPSPEKLPRKMRDIVYRAAINLYSGVDFDHQMERLIAGIDNILAEKAPIG